MIVIILAAGMGARFEDHEGPKALLPLANHKSILEQQLENVSSFTHLDHVILVVGYKSDTIRDIYPNLKFVENPDFATTNTAKSLMLALENIEGEDVLWLNGDVVFHPTALHSLIAFGKTAMVVNTESVDDEEVKYRTDGAGLVVEVSKTVEDAQGEAVGINLFKADDLPALKAALKKCQNSDYFEKALEYCIEAGVEIWSIPVRSTAAVEVDFADDLDKANQLVTRWEQGMI